MDSQFSVDWESGRIVGHGLPDTDEPSLCCTISGDWAPVGRVTYPCHEKVYGGLAPHLASADWNIVNIETVIGDAGAEIIKPGPLLRCGGEYLDLLTQPRFHLACLANNHAKDYGVDGLLNTISSLHEAGVATVGAAEGARRAAEPFRLERHGVKLAIINAAEGATALPENGGAGVASFDLPRLSRQIRGLKEEGYLVLGIFHVGREFVALPPPYIHSALHYLAEDGLDLIVCHHPHVVQGIEVYEGVPIFYSIGNFLYGRPDRKGSKRRLGLTVRCRFAPQHLQALELLPFEIGPEQLRLLEDEEKADFLADLNHLSSSISEERLAEYWDSYCALFDLEDILPGGSLRMRSPRHYYARLINRIETPAHREMILSLARQKLNGPQDVKPWVADLIARHPPKESNRTSGVRKIGRAMRRIRRRLSGRARPKKPVSEAP